MGTGPGLHPSAWEEGREGSMKSGLVSVNRHMTGAKPSHDGRNDAKLIQDIASNIKALINRRINTDTDILIKRIAGRFPYGRAC